MITAARQLALNTSSLRLKTLRLLLLTLLFYSGSGLANCCNVAQHMQPLSVAVSEAANEAFTATTTQDSLSHAPATAPDTNSAVTKKSPCHSNAVQEQTALTTLNLSETASSTDNGQENCCADCVLVALPQLPADVSDNSTYSALENLLVRFPSIIAPPAFRPPIALHI